MNDTVQEVYRRFGDHHMRSSNVFTDVEERIMEFRTQQMHTDDRITRMEVRVSNYFCCLFLKISCIFDRMAQILEQEMYAVSIPKMCRLFYILRPINFSF